MTKTDADYLLPRFDAFVAALPGTQGSARSKFTKQDGKRVTVVVTITVEGWVDDEGRLIVLPEDRRQNR